MKKLTTVLVLLSVVGLGQAGENDIIKRLEEAGVASQHTTSREKKTCLRCRSCCRMLTPDFRNFVSFADFEVCL
jgi:hypothetical protein